MKQLMDSFGPGSGLAQKRGCMSCSTQIIRAPSEKM
jgi:hypothetical protein